MSCIRKIYMDSTLLYFRLFKGKIIYYRYVAYHLQFIVYFTQMSCIMCNEEKFTWTQHYCISDY